MSFQLVKNDLVESKKTLNELIESTDQSIYYTLKNSIYPGAKDESISMVIAYCSAKKYDLLSKAVHIVPMKVKTGKKAKSMKGYDYDVTEERDVIMPGIASYRIDASRTGQYAGMSEPVFGPMITEKLGLDDFTYPEWCKITVRKFVQGQVFEFEAKEYWIENYASVSKDNKTPNYMWSKRKYGQLAKCTEAQALRKAFPDAVGNLPTYEEMEGKTFTYEAQEVNEKPKDGKGIDGLKAKLGLQVEEKSGEIIEQENTAPSLEDVENMIRNSTCKEDIEVVADVARSFSEEDKEKLKKTYAKKLEELKNKEQQ